MANDYPPEAFERDAGTKAAFLEGYAAMRHQYHLQDDSEAAWEASGSRRRLGESKKDDAITAHIAELNELAGKMRKGLHGNVVDIPVSPKLDEWVEDLDRILAASQPGK